MARYELRGDGASGVLALDGECTIEHAEELKKGFSEALERFRQVDLDLTGVERADLTLLQLVLAAEAELARDGRTLTAELGVPPVVADLAAEAGLTLGHYERYFWKKA